jgi:endo-1,4-beta-D-glucanase Y
MLRSLNAGDRATFELVWQWTKKNMQVRDSDKLFAWKFVIEKDGSTHLDDRNAATDADEDIAYSLAQAGKKWGNTTYISEAATIINDIWNNETIQKLGTRYVLSAPSEDKGGQLLVNPSYLAPADYRIFAGIDPKHDWDKVASDSYALLNRVQARSSAGLFSNWIAVNPDGTLSSADGLAVNGADTFGYDAFRINWRMADDKQDPRAQAILLKLASFYASEWTKHRLISAEYDLNGGAKSQYSDIPGSAGAIIGLHAVNNGIAYEIYREEIMPRYHAGKTYWGQPWNYYSQNWAAFSVQYLGIGGLGSSGDKL